MSMIIAHNLSAINTKRQFAGSSRGMSGAMERLSSGYKINTGKDDPSGLIISEQLRSQLNGLKRAQQNTEEAINVMGIAEGALNEMNSILKKMKALAIHSANNGVTSPDQIAADQAEMDSSIQTLDRIAQTTKFSDQNLLNGSKDIDYSQDTMVKSTQQNALLNARESSFAQIFKRDGYAVSFAFTGSANADARTGVGDVDFSQQAMKAYLEIDTAKGAKPQAQVDDKGAFSHDQAFTLTGVKGSRSFKFNKGATVAELVSQVKSAADSTGIDAALVFNSAQNIDRLGTGGPVTDMVQSVGVGLVGADGLPLPLRIQGSADNVAALKNDYPITVQGTGAFNSGTGMYSGYTVTVDGVTISSAWDGLSELVLSGAGFTEFGSGVKLLGLGAIDPVKSFGAEYVVSGALPGLGSLSPSSTNSGAITFTSGKNTYDQFNDEIKALLAGATNVTLEVMTVGTGNTSVGPMTVRLSGVDKNGNSFTFEDTFQFSNGDASTGSVTSNALKKGSIFKDGTTIDVGQCDATPYNRPARTSNNVAAITYTTPASSPMFTGWITKTQIDGVHNVGSMQSTGGISSGQDAVRDAGTIGVFNNDLAKDGTGTVERGVSAVTMLPGAEDSILFGMNTDGQGRIYVKFLDDNSFELYKDASLSAESKVATGINGKEIKETNNSGLSGLVLNITGSNLATKNGVYITTAGIEGLSLTNDPDGVIKNGVEYDGAVVNTRTGGQTVSGSMMFDAERTLITGVELGTNTSDEARIYLKSVYDHENGTVQVFAYKHKDMKDEDMVAKSEAYATRIPDPANPGDFLDVGSMTVVMNEIRNADNTAGTGLGIVLSVDGAAFSGLDKSTTLTGGMTFTNLGARIFAQDYGSENYLKITQDKGAVFTEYGTPGDPDSKRLIDAGSKGTTRQLNGQDATLSVNGSQVRTNGLNLSMATQDIQADLVFNQGKVGSTTLAQVGYETGSIFTKVGALNLGTADEIQTGKYAGLSGLLCNAGHNTNEKIGDFQAGMQLQLGEGPGDQNRTIVGIKAMTADSLGRIVKGGYWETGSPVWTEMTFTLKDVMGGGLASLSQDPVLSMSIIDKAISDVSETRALIGAMQANLLQTNSNNLSVTMENIQKTESGIRDADMADEMTDFTKYQVLQNAAMSMMTQANASAQSVLQLLQ